MPSAVRLGDTCTGHDDAGPRACISGSDNVFINGLSSHRVGDAWDVHDDHDGSQASGSPNVFVNGLSMARVGDAVSCGSACASGSDNVFAND